LYRLPFLRLREVRTNGIHARTESEWKCYATQISMVPKRTYDHGIGSAHPSNRRAYRPDKPWSDLQSM